MIAGITGDRLQRRIGIGFANSFVFRLKKAISFLFGFNFRPLPELEFRFNARAILTRFGGENSWDTWERDGTIVVKNLGYLEDEMDSITIEFDMYRYNYRPDPSHASMGFLRNMVHSLSQQVLPMDPVILQEDGSCDC
jgi:hypothetical protein